MSKIIINAGGSGYKINDKLDIDDANKLSIDGRSASLLVQDVDSAGSITKIQIENSGSGYIGMPSISGGSGTGANISFDINGSGIGGVKSLEIINSGYGYTIPPVLDFSNIGDGTATANTLIGGFDTTTTSKFINSDGFLNSNKYIQDSSFYQLFSYEITSGKNINEWRDIVKRLVHPAGLALFGNMQLISNIPLLLSLTNIVPDTNDRYTIIFHDGVSPPFVLDLRVESCDDEQDIRTFIDSDDYGGFDLGDDKLDYQPLPETLSTVFSSEDDFQPLLETLSTVFSSEDDFGKLEEPAATILSHVVGCPDDGICSPTDFGSISDTDTTSQVLDLNAEDYGRVRTPNFKFLPTKCRINEKDLVVYALTTVDGYDDYLYTDITPAGSYSNRDDFIEDYGSVLEPSTAYPEDYGIVSFSNTYFGTQKRLGPRRSSIENFKFNRQGGFSSYDSSDGVDGVVVFNGGSGYVSVPNVTVSPPSIGGVTATAVAVIDSVNGLVSSITITDGGSGYASLVPTITIDPPSTGTTAVATAVFQRNSDGNVNHYSQYQLARYVFFRGEKTNRVVDSVITQYSRVSDPDNAGEFYETSSLI